MAVDDITSLFQKAQETTFAANQKRYEQATAIYDEIISRYGPGGTFMAGAEAELGQAKKRDVSAEMAHSISSGLYGTTRTGTAGRRWEAEIGAPSRLKLEDLRMERLSQAQVGKAGLVERVEDIYPDYSSMANLLYQGAAAGGAEGAGGGYDMGTHPWEAGFMGGIGISPTTVGGGGYDTTAEPAKRIGTPSTGTPYDPTVGQVGFGPEGEFVHTGGGGMAATGGPEEVSKEGKSPSDKYVSMNMGGKDVVVSYEYAVANKWNIPSDAIKSGKEVGR